MLAQRCFLVPSAQKRVVRLPGQQTHVQKKADNRREAKALTGGLLSWIFTRASFVGEVPDSLQVSDENKALESIILFTEVVNFFGLLGHV